jgi:hypothetical protein
MVLATPTTTIREELSVINVVLISMALIPVIKPYVLSDPMTNRIRFLLVLA